MNRQLQAAIRERQQIVGPFSRAWSSMFDQQREAVVTTGDGRGAWCCGRRGGKTNGLALWLTEGALSDPGGLSLYVCWTQYTARITLLPAFYELQAEHGLEFREASRDNQLLVVFPNQHRIWLAGCKNSVEFGKFRGPKYRRAAWDEAQLAGEWLRDAIEDAIMPALSDKGGGIAMTGTPGINPVGYFYEASSGKKEGWANFNWTCQHNPYWRPQGDGAEYLAELRRVNGWTIDHPRYRREWLGEWIKDEGSLVFDWRRDRNAGEFPEHPEGRVITTIGVDLGTSSACAWVVLRTVAGSPEIYIVDCYQREGMIPSSVAAQTARLLQAYPHATVVVDEGGLGGGYAAEMRERHGIPCIAAKKTERRAAIEMLRGDVLSGVIKVDTSRCVPLLDEWSVLQWDEKHENFDERFADHLTDAALYAHRHCRPVYRPVQEEDQSPDAQAARYRKLVERRVLERIRQEGRGRR